MKHETDEGLLGLAALLLVWRPRPLGDRLSRFEPEVGIRPLIKDAARTRIVGGQSGCRPALRQGLAGLAWRR